MKSVKGAAGPDSLDQEWVQLRMPFIWPQHFFTRTMAGNSSCSRSLRSSCTNIAQKADSSDRGSFCAQCSIDVVPPIRQAHEVMEFAEHFFCCTRSSVHVAC